MGQALPKAVTSVVTKRFNGPCFRAGLAEMNGWRASMEDSHVVVMQDREAFFCICDGHGGDECSRFIAKRLTEELESGFPEDDEAVTELALRLDRDFLATEQQSGSTSTFVIITPPEEGAENYSLRVGNIGDSRVILGRADGTIVEGEGTDGGLTTDHKPDHPSERARIERTGGHVQEVMGVSRVNGDLAVSRAYGDAKYKQSGGPAQEDHPVSAAPEMFQIECGPTDFVLLVCDGISEGDFPNREVVKLAAAKLREGDKPDICGAATAVCRMALQQGSKDNLSCMIVLLNGGEGATDTPAEDVKLIPGPFNAPDNPAFRKAYEAMAAHASLSLVEAVELRYDNLCRELDEMDGNDAAEETRIALKQERDLFNQGPPTDAAPGSEERKSWFTSWLESQISSDTGGGEPSQLLELMQQNPRLLSMARQQGLPGLQGLTGGTGGEGGPKRRVKVAPVEQLKPAVESHSALRWDDRLSNVCEKEGDVLRDDPSDQTSQVKFGYPVNFQAWLPTSCLVDIRPELRRVTVAPLDDLKGAIENHNALKWNEKLATIAGTEGTVLVDDDSDQTSQVRFSTFTAWMPTRCLTNIESDSTSAGSTLSDSPEDV
jgi:serine/threonine protein phosphatase PrpC